MSYIIYEDNGDILKIVETFNIELYMELNNLKEFNYLETDLDVSEGKNYKIVNGKVIEKPYEEEIIEPIVSNSDLKKEIEELKEIIDIMLGGIDDGL
jgi:hypothetical protein